MTDDVLKELWKTKDNIAKEHGYSIDDLAEYYLNKQDTRRGRTYRTKKAESGKGESFSPPPHTTQRAGPH